MDRLEMFFFVHMAYYNRSLKIVLSEICIQSTNIHLTIPIMDSSEPRIVGQHTRHGREFVIYSDGRQYTRRTLPAGEWRLVEAMDAPAELERTSLRFGVVFQVQADGEPYHWSLFAY